jgi:hypothetical protein
LNCDDINGQDSQISFTLDLNPYGFATMNLIFSDIICEEDFIGQILFELN